MSCVSHRPVLWRAVIVLADLMILPLGKDVSVKAQPPGSGITNNSLRIPYEAQRTPRSAREIPPPSLPRALTRAERAQLAQTRQVAQSLAAHSDESFRRGLMPLGDYLRQLSLSYSLRQSVASFGEGETPEIVNRQEVARHREVVRLLEQFQQPAAEGWAADLALAHAHLARLEAEQGYLRGDSSAMQAAFLRQVDWSARHVELRRVDESLGIASPGQVVQAEQFERRARLDALPRYPTSEEYRTAYQAYRNQLGELEARVERWSEQGAGIGRVDRLHRVRFELAQADAIVGLLNQNETEHQESLKTAEAEASLLFESQREFYRNGTAELFELARTWSDRQSVYDQASDVRGFPSAESVAAHERDFQLLQTYTNQTRDRRGRIAADVEFISALHHERELVALRKKMTDPFREDGQRN